METKRSSIIRTLINAALFLILSTAAWAANPSPAIFYSDLTAGPNTGGQNNLGVFVTIWGNNFGSTQGSSYITVGGGKVNNYQTWTNTMICFQLGSLAATGNIVLVTSNGNATGPAFTVQAGNIYFVQPGAATNGTGTYTSPFNHLYYAYQVVAPGDTVYILAGTIFDQVEGYPGWHTLFMPLTSGTQSKPISWVAYPNATVTFKADGAIATWTDGSSGGTDNIDYIFRGNGSDWQTFSKLNLEFTGNASSGLANVADSNGQNGWKFVGNTSTALFYEYCQFCVSGANGSALGNIIENSGADVTNGNELHSIYIEAGSDPFEVGWNYMYNNENTGWEISNYHNGPRIGTIHDNLIVAASSGSVKGILVDGCGDTPSPDTLSTMETNVVKAYNNVIVGAGQHEVGGAMQANCGTNYIYNNTIYGSGTETDGVIQFEAGGIGPGGGHPVEYVANNIIYANNSGLYLSDATGNAPYSGQTFSLLSNNNYYGAGNGPTQDAAPVNANPQFVAPSTSVGGNFQLQSTSPDLNAGYNTLSVVSEDLNGLLRDTTPSIGAYEYTSATASPVVAITSPSSGISLTLGSNMSITAAASETGGTITNTAIYNGSTLLGQSSSSSYTYTMNDPAIGTYTLTAKATDAKGVSTTSSPVSVLVVSLPILPSSPVVNITSPTSGSSYTAGSNVTITTTASETGGTISNISLYNGSGILLGSKSSSPYSYVYSDILAGSYTFYAVAKDANGVSITSSAISVTATALPAAPSITTQPVNVTVTAPATATFTVTATGTPAPTYQWKQEASGATSYTAISGATSASYTTPATTSSSNGTKYECVVTNASGSVTSNAASLTVNTASQSASGTTIPSASQIVDSKGTVWTVAHGNSFQNGVADSGGGSSGNITLMLYYNGSVYVNTTDTGWWEWTTSWVEVSGDPRGTSAVAPSITAQPGSVTVTAPATATFTVTATGTPAPTYQWKQEASGATSYTAISGATSASYTTPVTTSSNNGTKYECVAANASGSVTSNAGTLTVAVASGSPVVAITSPTNGSSFTPGSNINVTVAASETGGTIAQVQFYIGSMLLGTDTTSPYTYTRTNVPAGTYSLTAKAIDANGVSTMSNPVTLTVAAPATPVVTITSPANNSNLTQGSAVTITANASESGGTIATVFFFNGSTFLGSDTTSPYTFTITNAPAGTYSLTAMAVDQNDNSATSNTVTVTVTGTSSAPNIITQPANVSVLAPATATFTVAATGPALTYQWYQNVGGTLYSLNKQTNASYSIASTKAALDGTQYECVITNAYGSATTSLATLSVN